MHYCDSCAVAKGYPINKDKSYGPCDVCSDLANCSESITIQINRPKRIPLKEVIMINTEK